MNNEAAIHILLNSNEYHHAKGDLPHSAASIEAFNKAVAALKAERPHGEWIYREEWFEDEEKPRMAWGCNLCGHSIKSVHEKLNFCPNCGAAMREGAENE